MFKYLKLIFFNIHLVYALDNTCFEKHYIPMDAENLMISKINLTSLQVKGFEHFPRAASYQNNGQTVIIKYIYNKNKTPILMDGPYGDDIYELEFMYFNWLNEKLTTEHEIPIELHSVFFNRKYETYEKASEKKFGLTVLSYRYKKHDELFQITNDTKDIYYFLKRVENPHTKSTIYHGQALLLPPYAIIGSKLESSYYVYQGRLLSTLQYCSVDVIWIEFADMIKINKGELKSFEKLLASDMKPMMSKFYETVAPNGPIYQKIDLDEYDGPPLPGFAGFNETSKGALTIRNTETLSASFITIPALLIILFESI